MTLTEDALARAAALDEQLAATGAAFAAAVRDELQPHADNLARLEAEHRAALHAAGIPHCSRPPARELAVEILHGRLGSLRPYLPMATVEMADRAEEALTTPCRCPERHRDDGQGA